jgi:hypothetical protein
MNVTAVEPRGVVSGEIDVAWTYVLQIEDGQETERRRVRMADSESVQAGFGEDGPDPEWITARLIEFKVLDNYRPVLEQVREWPDPLYLHPDPPDGG